MKQLIGIPWKRHGRDYSGADCLGLVYLYYRDFLGIEIEEFGSPEHFSSFRNMVTNDALYKHFDKIDSLENNCIVILPNERGSVHIGVYVGDNMLLHCPIKHMSCLENINKAYRNAEKRYFVYEAS